jgi:hypothetical protein
LTSLRQHSFIKESRNLVAWLDERARVLDRARSRNDDRGKRLQEFCRALITAAVTGQLDIEEAV